MAASVYWIARQFILDVMSKTRRGALDLRSLSIPPATAAPVQHVEMTLSDFRQIADMLKRELNGRYMFADEARKRFEDLENRLEASVEDLKRYIAVQLKESKDG